MVQSKPLKYAEKQGVIVKTVSMRIRGVSEDGEDLSALLPSMEKKFNSIGLTLKKNDNTFKSTYEIFSDLAKVWSSLSDFNRADILELVAGKLQGNVVASMLNNWKDAEGALQAGLNSFGSAARENEKYMESMQGHIAVFKNTVSEFWSNSVDSDWLKSIIDLGTKLVSTFGDIRTVVAIAAGVFLTFKSKAIASTITSLYSTVTALFTTRTALQATTGAAETAAVAMTGLQRALGVIGLLATAASVLYTVFSNVDNSIEKSSKLIDETNNKYSQLSEQLDSVASYYKENHQAIETDSNVKLQLFDMQNKLIDSFGEEAKGIDLVNGKYEDQVKKIDELQRKKLESELKDSKIINASLMDQKYSNPTVGSGMGMNMLIGTGSKNYKVADGAGFGELNVVQYYNKLKTLLNEIQNQNERVFASQNLIPKNSKEWENALSAVQSKLKEIEPLYNQIQHQQDLQNKLVINTFKTQSAAVKNYNEEQSKLFDNLTNVFSSQPTKDFQESMVEIQNVVRNFDGSNIQAVVDELKQIPSIQGNSAIVDNLNNIIEKSASASDSIANLVQGSSTDFDKLAESITSSKEEIELLTDAQGELAKNNTLSTSTVAKLNKMYGDFVKVTGLSKDKVLEFIKAKKEEKFEFIDSEIKKTETAIKSSKIRIEALQEEFAALKKIREERANQRIDELNQMVSSGLMSDSEAERQIAGILRTSTNTTDFTLQTELDELDELETKLNILKGAKSDLTATSAQADKQEKKSNDTYSETNEVLTETLKRLKELKTSQDELQKSRSKLQKGSEAYRKSLQDEIKILKEQKALYEDGIKHPEKLVALKVTSSTKDPTVSGSISSSGSSSVSSSTKYSDIINKYASAYGLDPNLVAAIIKTESSFNANATSKAGARGLMQLMPGTARGLGVSNSYDPEQNVMGGTKYFANLVKKYNGDIELALMAYNGGPGRIDKWLKSGKSISLPTETKNYAGKVLSAYNGYSGSSAVPVSTANISSNDSVKNSVKGPSVSDKANAVDNAKQSVNSIDSNIYELTVDYIQDFVTQSENRIDRLGSLISQSQGKQSNFSEGSAEWRKEESSQSYYLQEQQKELENENKQLDKLIKENKITSGEFDKQKSANSEKWWDLEKQIQEKRFNIIQSFFTEYDSKINKIKAQYDTSQAKLGLLTEGTEEYNAVLQSQIPLLRQEQKEHQAQIDLINKQINNDKLTAAQKEELINRLHTETAAWLDNESAIKSNIEQLQSLRESAADKIIEDYKSMIEKQRDLELDAFEQRKETENKRHEQVKKNLEDENKLFEDVINAQLKALDRQNASDDHEDELNKKLNERQELQDKINELALDDSIEGRAKKKDLEEQLDAKDEEIAKFKLDRERELRKQSLQDQLDDHKKQNDQIADSEDKLNQEINDNIDQEKKAVEQKYKDILENDKLYYELKQGLLSEDSNVVKATLAELQTGYDTYFGTLKGHVFDTDQEFKNLNFTLEKSLELLQKYSNGDYSAQDDFPSGYTPPSDINSDTGTSGGSKVTPDALMAWSNYLNNKLQAETLRNKMSTLDKKSQQYKDAENTFNNLSRANANYRSTYKFKDGSYDQLKSLTGTDIFSAETGGMTPSWGKSGKFLLAHEKELVLNKTDTSNLITAVDITRSIVDGLRNLTSLIKPQSSSPALAGYGNIQMDITIERLTGDENGARTFFNTIQKNLRKSGK